MKQLLTTLFIFQVCAAWGQEQGMFKISASANRTSFGTRHYNYTTNGNAPLTIPARTLQGYGLALEYYIGDYVSLSYCLEFGNTTQGARYMRYPLGPQLAVIPFLSSVNYGGSDALYLAMLLAILPEGIHLHMPIQEGSFYISPYISPFGIFREKLPNQLPTPSLGFSTGAKIEVFSKNFAIAPYAGVRTLYRSRSGGWGIEAGLHIGLLIGD